MIRDANLPFIGRPWSVLVFALYCSVSVVACGMAVPEGAYRPDPFSAQYQRIIHSMYRAAIAVGEDPKNYRVGFIRSPEISAANAGAGTFYFTDGLTNQTPEIIDAIVAHEVAHEVLGHVGHSIAARMVISALFSVAGTFVPGLQYADYVVNPLITRAFDRHQEFEADSKAIDILRRMGYPAPEALMLQLLTKLKNRYGAIGGELLATHPNIEDRIAKIEKLQSSVTKNVSVPPPPEKEKEVPRTEADQAVPKRPLDGIGRKDCRLSEVRRQYSVLCQDWERQQREIEQILEALRQREELEQLRR